ncbi:MAG: hypothetical protein KDB68_07805 [Planctomycetes bacterium]|nr:hypothetical protein [Planctomycetota bacterium]MCA8947315.1 hypothetical protein [Planctomycetota bacterium]
MPHSDKMLDEELLVRESARKAAASEHSELRARGFSREAAIACMVLCMVGLAGLSICVVGNFDLRVGTSGGYEVTDTGHGWALMRSSYDLTTLFAGIGAAGFASALIICGGAFGQLKRMPPGSAYAVGMSAVVSIVGLLMLAFVG